MSCLKEKENLCKIYRAGSYSYFNVKTLILFSSKLCSFCSSFEPRVLCSLGWLQTHCVTDAGLDFLTFVSASQAPDTGVCDHA